jgi:hypothetical protein
MLWVSMENIKLKTSYEWSNVSVDALLTLIGKMLPAPHSLLALYDDARK